MGYDLIGTEFQLGKPSKSRLQCTYKLCFQLAVKFLSCVLLLYISAHISIKKKRICNPVGIYAMTTHRHINIQSDPGIHNTERDRCRSSKFIIYQLLGIKIINPLILTCISTVCKTLADGLEGTADTFPKASCKNTWFCGCVISILSRICADIHNFSLLYDHHALTVCYCDPASAGNDIVTASLIGRSG